MEHWLDILQTSLPAARTVNSIMATNEYTAKFGLVLSEEQALRLAKLGMRRLGRKVASNSETA